MRSWSALTSSSQTGVWFRTPESFFNRLLGPVPRDSGVEFENVHVWQVPKWCLICESRDHTWIHHGWKLCWREFWPQQACYKTEQPFQRDDICYLSAVLECAGVVFNRKHQGQGWLIPSASYDTFLPCKMIWPRDGCQISKRTPLVFTEYKFNQWGRTGWLCQQWQNQECWQDHSRRKEEGMEPCSRERGWNWLEISRSAISMVLNLRFNPMFLAR